MSRPLLRVHELGLQPYNETWRTMQAFTGSRNEQTHDEFWCLEHPAVFTLGSSKQPSPILASNDIPVIKTDRGGQVTYHGPGQIVGYFLWDLRRLHLNVHQFVELVEQSMIDTLSNWNVNGSRWPGNPGVYVNGKKMGALGLRVRKGCSYHGLSLNVKMDKRPFGLIDPCGIDGLEVTQLADFDPTIELPQVQSILIDCVQRLHTEVAAKSQ